MRYIPFVPHLAGLLALGLSACGDATEVTSDQEVSVPGPGIADHTSARSTTAADDSFVSLSGIVTEKRTDGFTMRHGNAAMRVEMDDWDSFPEGSAIRQGDAVVVRGVVDRDLWERNKIEASSVYVESLNAYLYASAADEEDHGMVAVPSTTERSGDEAVGYVTRIEGSEFTIGVGSNAVRVDTARMEDSPLGQSAERPLRVGDRVFAFGRLDIDGTEGTELMAQGVVRLVAGGSPASAKRPAADQRPTAGATPAATPRS